MNNCPKCHAPIPDLKLSCPACAERASCTAFLALQKRYLPSILADARPLLLTRPAKARLLHIVMLGEPDGPHHAWCGEEVSPQWKVRDYHLYSELLRQPVCALCLEKFEIVRREAA